VVTRLLGARYEVLFPKIRKKIAPPQGRLDFRPLFHTYLFVFSGGTS
jgi:hypothetical protein